MTHSELRDLMRSIANVDINRLPDSEATEFLNQSQDDMMENHALRFRDVLLSTAFVENTQTINPAPTDGLLTEVTRLWYADSAGDRVEVKPMTWNEYVEWYGTATTAVGGFGDPIRYSIYGEDSEGNPTIYLGPIPDADRSPVYLAGRKRFLPLSDDGDHNQLTDRAGLAVVYKALMFASSFLENVERMPEWEAAYKPIMSRLEISHSRSKYAGMHARSMNEPG